MNYAKPWKRGKDFQAQHKGSKQEADTEQFTISQHIGCAQGCAPATC